MFMWRVKQKGNKRKKEKIYSSSGKLTKKGLVSERWDGGL